MWVIDKFGAEVGSEREVFFWNLTLELGRAVAETQLAWAESVVERLQSGDIPA